MDAELQAAPPARNPFASRRSRANSSYYRFDGRSLRRGGRAAGAETEFVHDSLRSMVLTPLYPCVGARSAFNQANYGFGLYDELGSAPATAGLARDLWRFTRDRTRWDGEFSTFVACFRAPLGLDEVGFEQALWQQLQDLHALDRLHHGWDSHVSSDPGSPDFAFSFAGEAFFIVGLHGASSRYARRFAWPTLVFNPHDQFERLRREQLFERLQDAVRGRDTELQGDLNPNLAEFGDASEARQYSGREVAPGWRCPFHANQ